MYCQALKEDKKKKSLSLWRHQMKKLEENPKMERMYDLIGKDQICLAEERE